MMKVGLLDYGVASSLLLVVSSFVVVCIWEGGCSPATSNSRVAVAAFQQPLTSSYTLRQRRRHPLVVSATIEEEGMDTTRTKTTQQSARLAKAKSLLEQFSSTTEIDDFFGTTTTTTTKGRTHPQTSTPVPPKSKESPSSVVPDTYWSNGHLLQDSNYVTRWAKGVKVAEPLVKYDPMKAKKILFKQPNKWLVRNIQIAFPIGLWAVNVVLDTIMGNVQSSTYRKKRAKQLLQAISGLGPAIIKGGQALASRPDLLPSEYLEELQKLQDDVPRFSNQLAFATVEEELNIKFNDVFQLLQEEPVAAASIGQVYQAKLRSNGNVVALKIQRPNCEEIIALDLYILRWWSGIYNQIFTLLNRDIDVQAIIDDFGELIYREIDYIAEAANAQRFNELYANIPEVFVPKIYSDLTTSKVLTMEWVNGYRLTDNDNLVKYNLEPSKLVDVLVQCSLKQILENGFFHADPHAGNLLACEDGRLCYLDFGMMSYANQQQRNGFLLAVVHIVNRDWNELVKLYVKLGFIPVGTNLQPIELALENALPDVLNSEISELNFKNVVNKLGDIMYTYPFSLPPFYIAIIRCLGVLEGLAIQVDPQARIISEAYPYVASRVLTDKQDDLQEAFYRLALTNDRKSIRWDRLESLLDEAIDANDYDPAAALEIITDYLISNDGETILKELTQTIVDVTDNLGTETIQYVINALNAVAINDEIALVRAFRSLQTIVIEATTTTTRDEENETQIKTQGSQRTTTTTTTTPIRRTIDVARRKLNEDLTEVLPEPTPTMQRFGRIIELLGVTDSSNNNENTTTNNNSNRGRSISSITPYVPVIRKLSQEPRIQRAVNEIIARLGERLLSRTLRATFGLPPPQFGNTDDPMVSRGSSGRTTTRGVSSTSTMSRSPTGSSTVTEERNYY